MADAVPECGVDDFMISGLYHGNLLTDVCMQAILTKQPESCTHPWVSSVENSFQACAVDGPRGSWRARHGKRHRVSPR